MGDSGFQVFVAADDGTLSGTKEEKEKKLAERRLFEIDQYYHIIEKFTFKTAFIDISVEEGKAWRDYNRGATLDDSQNTLLNDLQSRIDKVIQEFAGRGNASFFRLSTRSPKDAVDKLPELKELLKNEINSSKAKYNKEDLTPNQLLVALRRAFFKVMSVRSVSEAMKLVMYSSRAISDLKRALDHLDVSPWNMKAIVREFVDIPIEGEFRGFVYNKNLTALSQYYADCFFEDLPPRKAEIEKAVQEFFSTHIRDLLPFSSYIIDFVIFKDNSVMIVELNPYSVNTGSCLFDWQKDKEVLENGPFELRINTVENKNAEGYLMPFKPLISQALSSESSPANNNTTNSNTSNKEENKNCLIM